MIKKISAGVGLAIMTAALAACTGSPSGASFAPNGSITSGQSHAIHRMDAGIGGAPVNSGGKDDAGIGGAPTG